MMKRVRMVLVSMPNSIGVAIAFITSLPTPLLSIIGMSEAIMLMAVISFGRTRFAAPCITHSSNRLL